MDSADAQVISTDRSSDQINQINALSQELSAVARALGVVEIYENILINLNYHALVTCLRVNKHTEAVILKSTALRKISWLEPDEPCPMEDISGQLVPADVR